MIIFAVKFDSYSFLIISVQNRVSYCLYGLIRFTCFFFMNRVESSCCEIKLVDTLINLSMRLSKTEFSRILDWTAALSVTSERVPIFTFLQCY